ncbi:heme/copper-type cytochrome/quinol oxidase subunit 3 [Pedobacter sp. UYEF25]
MENKLMMKLVIATEAILFISLVIAYVYFALNSNFGSQSKSLLNIKAESIFTMALFLSSFTLYLAERNYKKGNYKNLKIWMIVTVILGFTFLSGQAIEYKNLLAANFTISNNMFGTNYFTLTGFHAFHVIVGLVMLCILIYLIFKGNFRDHQSNVIETIGLYWHFVDVVWVIVFTLIYVSPYFIR